MDVYVSVEITAVRTSDFPFSLVDPNSSSVADGLFAEMLAAAGGAADIPAEAAAFPLGNEAETADEVPLFSLPVAVPEEDGRRVVRVETDGFTADTLEETGLASRPSGDQAADTSREEGVEGEPRTDLAALVALATPIQMSPVPVRGVPETWTHSNVGVEDGTAAAQPTRRAAPPEVAGLHVTAPQAAMVQVAASQAASVQVAAWQAAARQAAISQAAAPQAGFITPEAAPTTTATDLSTGFVIGTPAKLNDRVAWKVEPAVSGAVNDAIAATPVSVSRSQELPQAWSSDLQQQTVPSTADAPSFPPMQNLVAATKSGEGATTTMDASAFVAAPLNAAVEKDGSVRGERSDSPAGRGGSPAVDHALLAAARTAPLLSSSGFAASVEAARSFLRSEAAPQLPNESGVAASIVQAMRLQWRDGSGSAVIQLQPEYLGSVTVALRVQEGIVTATLHAEDPQVRAWIQSNESSLRQGLSDQGLALDRLVVSEKSRDGAPNDSEARRRPQADEQPPKTPRRGAEGTFEIVV